jgi:hypothetical protein
LTIDGVEYMMKKCFTVVYWDESGKKEAINTFMTKEEAEAVYMKCMEGDPESQINQSYDIEEGYLGVPGH